MSPVEIYQVTLGVLEVLENLGVEYLVGGSLASMVHGVPRSTLDADIVIDLRPERVEALAAALGPAFLVNAEALKAAFVRQRSYNIIHLESMLKVDLYPFKHTPFGKAEFSRRVKVQLPGTLGRWVWCCSPEDIVLQKLSWYRQGGQVAQRQWLDAIEVIRLQGAALDRAYLIQWADALGVAELLNRAFTEAGA